MGFIIKLFGILIVGILLFLACGQFAFMRQTYSLGSAAFSYGFTVTVAVVIYLFSKYTVKG